MDPRSERFPDAPVADLPSGVWAELRALGEELQSAQPAESELSAGFAEELRHRLEGRPWEFRAALRERPLLRVAAALLVISTVAAPVSALVLLWRPAVQDRVDLTWRQQGLPAEIEEGPQRPELLVVPPVAPAGFEDAFGVNWQASIAASNRSAVMFAQWHDSLAGGVLSAPSPAPAHLDWSSASVEDLQHEFQRRAQLGLTAALPASLAERVDHFAVTLNGAELPAEIQAWTWVLHGEGPPPVPRYFERG
jgi:hypothetical protein